MDPLERLGTPYGERKQDTKEELVREVLKKLDLTLGLVDWVDCAHQEDCQTPDLTDFDPRFDATFFERNRKQIARAREIFTESFYDYYYLRNGIAPEQWQSERRSTLDMLNGQLNLLPQRMFENIGGELYTGEPEGESFDLFTPEERDLLPQMEEAAVKIIQGGELKPIYINLDLGELYPASREHIKQRAIWNAISALGSEYWDALKKPKN